MTGGDLTTIWVGNLVGVEQAQRFERTRTGRGWSDGERGVVAISTE
jgi:hypothetical protein